MEFDTLKSAWQSGNEQIKSSSELKNMMQVTNHSAVRRMRRQLATEVLLFSLFLFVYYDFFDGDQKPLYANVILMVGILAVIVHNVIHYSLLQLPSKGSDLKQLLKKSVARIRLFTITAVSARILAGVSLLIFFSSVIVFNTAKYWILGVVILVFIVQMILFIRIWRARTRNLELIIESL
jgi:membrane protein YdbS with pleckstrin-like domain